MNSEVVFIHDSILLYIVAFIFRKMVLKLSQVISLYAGKFFSKKGRLHLLRTGNGMKSLFSRVHFICKLTVKIEVKGKGG